MLLVINKGFRPYGRKGRGSAAGCVEGLYSLRSGATAALPLRIADCRSAAMLIKSALRIYLSASYVMKSITVISHLRWLSPLWCLTAPPSRPAGKRVTRFSGRFAPLRIVFPCHRGIGRATKGKRLYGQARRLTSPDLHILCRMCTVDNKAPQSNPFTQRIAKNKVPPPGGRWWRQPPKGVHFPRPQGGCMVLYKPAPSII